MINNVLLVYVPSREGAGEGDLPLGFLYVGNILERLGINVKIFDLYLYDLPKEDRYGYLRLKEVINNFNPDIVGFGGIATSYTWTKELSNRLKKEYPKIMQIAGGALSSVNELLLKKTAIDVVFHGEAESNLPLFIESLNAGTSYYQIPGISYLEDGEIKRNQPSPQIKNLDDLAFPAYHLVDITKYFTSKQELLNFYKDDLISQGLYSDIVDKLRDVEYFLPIFTSRGCMYRCSFCYRHMSGYRKHSVNYIIRHIKFLMDRFGINGFSFMDELFNGDIEWVIELCDQIENNNLKIAYRTSGVRVDKVSERMLRRLYETGCFNLNYGQESGSDKILKEYRKGVSREDNIKTTLLTRKCGIYSTVQLVIGSPGETQETIMETVDFLREVGVRQYSLNYLIPFPRAPIWSYVKANNLIKDTEDYLAKVARLGGGPIVNLTKVSNKVWRNWGKFIQYKIDLYYAKRNGDFLGCIKVVLIYHLKRLLPEKLKRCLKKSLGYIKSLEYR